MEEYDIIHNICKDVQFYVVIKNLYRETQKITYISPVLSISNIKTYDEIKSIENGAEFCQIHTIYNDARYCSKFLKKKREKYVNGEIVDNVAIIFLERFIKNKRTLQVIVKNKKQRIRLYNMYILEDNIIRRFEYFMPIRLRTWMPGEIMAKLKNLCNK